MNQEKKGVSLILDDSKSDDFYEEFSFFNTNGQTKEDLFIEDSEE
jgi:hypothetical protein